MSINNKRQYEMTLNVNSSVTVPTMQVYNTDENIFDLKVYVTVNENTITESKLKTEIKRNKNISISCIKTNIVMLMMINFYLLFLKYYK